ncbi:MAG: Uma2 family endonuclease [Planctomycetales bacterium]|nr:Uma2 family endonuclease [Planctomycetales bacterium]
MNAAVSYSMADRLADLGDIPTFRVRTSPSPGSATIDDLIRIQGTEGRLYELVDRTLVEKVMGWQESLLAAVLLQWLGNFLDDHDLGVMTGPDGQTRLFSDTVRGPDVAFVSWLKMPGGKLPVEPVPNLVPDFVVEVISVHNTRAEMSRKRREYFHAGVKLVWMVDPRARTVAVFRSPDDVTIADEGESIDGGEVLPGWKVDLALLFGKLDRKAPDHDAGSGT